MNKGVSNLRVLTLDGGGAKGFYTLGVLREIEALIDTSFHEHFDIIYGTSTGSIIAALLALGHSVSEVHQLYQEHVIKVVGATSAGAKSAALSELATTIFGDRDFSSFRTNIGIVTVNWANEKPMIFKSDVRQAHGRASTFKSGFGCKIADAVEASCSAYPFFKRKVITTPSGDRFELADGGYCANNPTLYAIADASNAQNRNGAAITVISIGVGIYPAPKRSIFEAGWWIGKLESVRLLQKTLEINTQSMEQLRSILYPRINAVRICDTYTKPELATDLFESNLDKLNALYQCGRESFASHESALQKIIE